MGKHLLGLQKTERLSSKKLIGQLFETGSTGMVYPIKYVFINTKTEEKHPAEAAFSVSKKNFKLAVKRNLLKRRMREAYRLNKPQFYEKIEGFHLAVMFIYIAKEELPYQRIEKAMKDILNRLAK